MPSLLAPLRKWLIPSIEDSSDFLNVAPGLYHFHRVVNGEHIRYHLRVDEDGPGILIAAASEALLVSPTGAAIAKALLEGKPRAAIERLSTAPGWHDAVADVADALDDLGLSSVRYPIFNLVDPAHFQTPWRLSAPFQADVDVISTETTRQIIDQLWNIRVPHVRFLVTPRTDRTALVELVVHAEDLGMIAGVRAHGIRWYHEETVRRLAEAGVDYVVFPYMCDEAWHDSLYGRGDRAALPELARQLLSWEVTPLATLPIVPAIQERLEESLDHLQDVGVHHAEVFAVAEARPPARGLPDERTPPEASVPTTERRANEERRAYFPHELRQLAAIIEDLADARHMQLIWLPPHGHGNHESLDSLILNAPRAGGDVTIRIDGQGNVLPPRGPAMRVGNLLVDPWEEIWNNSVFLRYRGRIKEDTRCPQCPGMAICAADCPAETISWVHP